MEPGDGKSKGSLLTRIYGHSLLFFLSRRKMKESWNHGKMESFWEINVLHQRQQYPEGADDLDPSRIVGRQVNSTSLNWQKLRHGLSPKSLLQLSTEYFDLKASAPF